MSLPSIHAPPRSPHRPGWYISRGNDVYVPLIAADELPDYIQLKGLIKRMGLDDIRRSGMRHSSEYLGEVIGDGSTFSMVDSTMNVGELEKRMKNTRLLTLGDANENMTNGFTISPWRTSKTHQPTNSVPQASEGAPASHSQIPTATAGHMNHASLSTATHRPLPPSGHEPDASRKIYCTHWIRTGECDYLQQGCYYKHEMPDRATLASIGFRTVPRWWQEHVASTPHSARTWIETKKAHPGRSEQLSGVWAHGQTTTATTTDIDSGSDGASSSDLPPGNPDTARWTRNRFPHNKPPTANDPVRKEHIIGKAEPPARVPVLDGPNPKADPSTLRKEIKAPETKQDRIDEHTDLITLDMEPLVPSPPPTASQVPPTPVNSPTRSGLCQTSASEPQSGVGPKQQVARGFNTSLSSFSSAASAPQVKGCSSTKSAITQEVEKQREKQQVGRTDGEGGKGRRDTRSGKRGAVSGVKKN